MNGSPLMEVSNISMRFGATQALDKVSLSLFPSQVLGIIGENGAGKSTLMKIIAGVYPPDEGEIKLNGDVVHLKGPADAQQKGISIIYQELTLCNDLTAYQNVFLHMEPSSKLAFGTISVLDNKQMKQLTRGLLQDKLGYTLDLDKEIRYLNLQEKKLVEIARALAKQSTIIIMDEPTAALELVERAKLFSVIANLKAAGCGVLYISHYIDEVLQLCDAIKVLRDGKDLGTYDKAELTINKVIRLMIGKTMEQQYYKAVIDYARNETMLAVHQLSLRGIYKNIDLSVKAGEIVGLAGLRGSGKSELGASVFGLYPHYTGSIFIKGKEIRLRSAKDAIANGIAYLPEDRKTNGLFLDQDLGWNVTIAQLKLVGKWFVSRKLLKGVTNGFITSLGIKTRGYTQLAGALSGGNQQKVMLARWLFSKPEVIILDEPTRGIDVQAKTDVYKELASCARSGKAVIIVSSDLAELVAICDRVVVMCEGQVVNILSGSSKTQDNIMYYSVREQGT